MGQMLGLPFSAGIYFRKVHTTQCAIVNPVMLVAKNQTDRSGPIRRGKMSAGVCHPGSQCSFTMAIFYSNHFLHF